MTVALYTRLSPKPNGGGYEGVDDQIAWGTAYAEKAWPGEPIEVFADRGKSAGRDDVRREDFDRLREWVKAGQVDPPVVRRAVPITRREIEWFEFAAELDAEGITELHTNRDGIVRVEDEVAGIKAVLAASERNKMLSRLHDTLTEKAAKGEPPGVRPFGYGHAMSEDGTKTYEVVPEQAEAIRFAAEKVLAGWSLASIAADLDSQGVRGTHGGKVTSGTVKGWLTAPASPVSVCTPGRSSAPATGPRSWTWRRSRRSVPASVEPGRCRGRTAAPTRSARRTRATPVAGTCSPAGWPCAVSARLR